MDIRKKFLTVVAGFAVAALFSACGDDSGSNSSRGEEPSPEVAELELANGKAVVCDDDMEGVVAITADDGYRKCVDGEWIKIRKLEAMKADKIIGLLDDDDDNDDDADTESSSSQKQSSSSKKPSIFDEDDDVIPNSSSSVIPSDSEGSSSVTPTEYVVDSYEDLPVCTAKREGSTAEVEDTGKKYKCEDGEWLAIKTTAKSSSSGVIPNSSNSVIPSEVEGSSSSKGGSSVIYVCPDGSVVANLENCKTPSSSPSDTPNTSASETPGTSTSETPGTSSGVIPGTDPESSSDEAVDLPYATKCPAGHTCTYAPTEYLNPKITYGELLDERDYQMYKTVEICDKDNKNCQTWMAQNLNYAYTGVLYNYNSWCYENKASNCDKYGRLYTWSAVMDSAAQFSVNAGTRCGYGKTCTPNSPHRGICPEGWHVPTNEEYSTLYTYIGGSSTAGSLLKSTSGWNDYNGKSGNGTDKYGFSVLPAGYWNLLSGYFYDEGYDAGLWSASEEHSGRARYQYFYYIDDNAGQVTSHKGLGYGLRCLKDSPDQGGEASNSSSSSVTPNSSGVIPSEVEGSSSSKGGSGVIPGTDPEPPSEVKADGYYKTNCPAGLTCKYATTTDYLNSSKTYGEILDTRDGQVYKAIEICDKNDENCQTWMAQNLNYGDVVSWCGGGSGSMEGDCSKYGRLYTWGVAMDKAGCGYGIYCNNSNEGTQGICPSGWHLPSDEEWRTLFENVGGTGTAGQKLKANTSLWTTYSGVTNDDSFGFAVLPAGSHSRNFYNEGDNAYFWSSTEGNNGGGIYWLFYYDKGNVYYDWYSEGYGHSVRCIRD